VGDTRRPVLVVVDRDRGGRGRPCDHHVHAAGEDNDEGALAGSRADERQKLLSLRSRALAGTVAIIAAYTGLVIATAARSAVWWPFAVMLAVTGFGYLFGLSTYGVGEEGPADDAQAGHEAEVPVSS
jgi:hypothetical protein